MYDPVTARFLQEDTYSGNPNDPLSLNLYTYTMNNPLVYYDPAGFEAVRIKADFYSGEVELDTESIKYKEHNKLFGTIRTVTELFNGEVEWNEETRMAWLTFFNTRPDEVSVITKQAAFSLKYNINADVLWGVAKKAESIYYPDMEWIYTYRDGRKTPSIIEFYVKNEHIYVNIEELAYHLFGISKDEISVGTSTPTPTPTSTPIVTQGTNKSVVNKTTNGLIMPIVTGTEAGYVGDTGLDIAAPIGTDCVAATSGTLVYSEYGHTRWRTPPDTPYSVLIKIDTPITYNGRTANYIWYTHLSSLKYNVKRNDGQNIRVNAGDFIGKSGLGNNNAHLHFGIIINQSQATKNDYFSMEEVRAVLGLKKGQKF